MQSGKLQAFLVSDLNHRELGLRKVICIIYSHFLHGMGIPLELHFLDYHVNFFIATGVYIVLIFWCLLL